MENDSGAATKDDIKEVLLVVKELAAAVKEETSKLSAGLNQLTRTAATKEELDEVATGLKELVSATKKEISEVISILKDFMNQTSERFNQVDSRFELVDLHFEKVDERLDRQLYRIDNHFNQLEQRLDVTEQKYNHLINTADGFIGRIDEYEVEQTVRDSRLERLHGWAAKVSKKTGIPLESI